MGYVGRWESGGNMRGEAGVFFCMMSLLLNGDAIGTRLYIHSYASVVFKSFFFNDYYTVYIIIISSTFIVILYCICMYEYLYKI